jgi:hypothetical protein
MTNAWDPDTAKMRHVIVSSSAGGESDRRPLGCGAQLPPRAFAA